MSITSHVLLLLYPHHTTIVCILKAVLLCYFSDGLGDFFICRLLVTLSHFYIRVQHPDQHCQSCALRRILLYYIVLYCITLYYIILFYIILYYFILFYVIYILCA